MRFIRPPKNNKNGLDATFRDGLKNTQATPDPDMWNRINDELDADIKKRKYHHWYLAAILILLPITLTNVFVNYDLEEYYNSFSLENEMLNFQANSELKGELQTLELTLTPNQYWSINKYFIASSNTENGNNPERNNIASNGNSGSNTNQSNLIAATQDYSRASNLISNEDQAEEESNPVYLANLSSDFIEHNANTSIVKVDALNSSDYILTDKETFKNNSKASKNQELNDLQKGIYLGVSSGVQYNKLLRREGQFAPFLGDNVKLESTPALTYGARLGWNFNRFLALETGIYKSSMDVQFLDNKYDKIFTEGRIGADYIEIPVSLKFKYTAFNRINGLPHSIGLNTGFTYAKLTSNSFEFGEFQFANTSQFFDTHQLALGLGLEYEWFIHKNVSLIAMGNASAFSSKQDFPKFSPKNANSDLRLNYQFQIGMNFLLPISK